ncbi:MAG: metallophosphoesterase [Clostridia bacterium]|nr:metallophosphoesterase [Clostridia bacterium]
MVYSFYHITDVHYYSKRNFLCDWRNMPQPDTQVCIIKSEEAFKKALEIIEADQDTKTVIITGDLTNHGESYSHEEVRDILKAFTERGGNPFVYTDNHDYPYFSIYSFDENGEKIPAEHLPEDEVRQMYAPFGRDKAFDTFDDGTTYIAEILPGLYHIAMGYDTEDKDSLRSPYFSDELMAWVKEHTDRAREKGATVICSTHRPVVAPSPAYAVVGKGHSFPNGETSMKQLADMGVRLFFSGHSHIQCMKVIESENGNRIYSVQTSCLAAFPPKMRKITVDTDAGTADIRTIDIELPDLGMSFTEYSKKGFLGIIEEIPYNMEHDVEAFANTQGGVSLPKEFILKHPKTVMFLGKKLNGLTYAKVAKFSKKYHNMKKKDYEAVKDKKFVNLLLEMISNLYRGNAPYSPDTVEYKITMGSLEKIEKIMKCFRVDSKKLLGGYTLAEFIEPLLYNSGIDDDNAVVSLD